MTALVVCAVTLSTAAVTFPLEWNPTYRTVVPYEIEISPEKLGAKSFTVFADGKPLETAVFRGKLPGTIALHFNVPAGTKGLKVSTDEDVAHACAPFGLPSAMFLRSKASSVHVVPVNQPLITNH